MTTPADPSNYSADSLRAPVENWDSMRGKVMKKDGTVYTKKRKKKYAK